MESLKQILQRIEKLRDTDLVNLQNAVADEFERRNGINPVADSDDSSAINNRLLSVNGEKDAQPPATSKAPRKPMRRAA